MISGLLIVLGLLCNYIDDCYQAFSGGFHHTQRNAPHKMVYFANCFVMEYLSKILRKNNLDEWPFFKSSKIIKILELVFQWLYDRGYSEKYLKLKEEE